ncbi:MAG: hypothetical protein JSW27_04710 [Phycisphaerales bacterium]|nr:MAG: hypothetical protein JSW27_04710 [Phycisphaerales bacterium]
MNDNEKLKDIINQDLNVRAGDATHDRMRDIVLDAHRHSEEIASADARMRTRSILMKHPITKLAVTAAVVAAVLIGIGLFSNSGSGVVWAEVAQNVGASPGVIWRIRGTGSRDPNDDWPNGYTITWRSAAITRTDKYRNGQIYRTIYYDLDARTVIGVLHDAQMYDKRTMSDERVQRARADKDRWNSPQGLVDCCLALKHHTLDQRTIDGVLCEGIETTDTSGLPFKSFTGRLWVAVETGYPVLVEIEAVDAGGVRRTTTLDQFQWNVDLSAEDVEPEIPADYEPL